MQKRRLSSGANTFEVDNSIVIMMYIVRSSTATVSRNRFHLPPEFELNGPGNCVLFRFGHAWKLSLACHIWIQIELIRTRHVKLIESNDFILRPFQLVESLLIRHWRDIRRYAYLIMSYFLYTFSTVISIWMNRLCRSAHSDGYDVMLMSNTQWHKYVYVIWYGEHHLFT